MSIILNNICKQYGDNIVLDHFSFTFKDNKSYCIMAPSGQGKTTLLHILMGLVEADSGNISGLDQYVIAPVFQENRLCENLSVGTNIKMVSREKISSQKITTLLDQFLLPSSLRKTVRTLSGGMKRRVALARALCSQGNLFLFDEPFKGLDISTKEAVMHIVKKNFEGKTAIWVSHDPDEAEFMGSEIVRLGGTA
ncbi:MAG: ATP-binding cassette domain-containing protein [Treponema sp.]|jgi:ABC-type multidrug transport system ATPase subunit|nr:ATP-binding cassette domain-containing protein [Treponema sp.]